MTLQSTLDVLVEPRRRELLALIQDSPRGVSELVEATGLSQPGVSKHLRMLCESGFVVVEKQKQRRVYTLAPGPLIELDNWLADYRARWSNTLDALEGHLKEDGT